MMKRLFIIVCTTALFLPFEYHMMAETTPLDWPIVLMQDVKSAIRQAEARFQSGNVSGAADLARKILEKYPGNADAQTILDKCIETEKSDFMAAANSLNIDQLAAFQLKYPSSSYNSRIEQLMADVPLWNIARKENTIVSYKKYLSESSHHLFKNQADQAIQDITIKQAYDAAVSSNTITAFEQFRNSYPGSKFDKDASNKIARLMADRFNSRSTYSDKYDALKYAQNELTRDYVNNKFNKATEKKNSTSSSSRTTNSTYSSNSSSNRASNPRSSSNTSRTKSYNLEEMIRFGINLFGDLGVYGLYSDDVWYDSYPFSVGIGGQVRVGDQRKPINFISGIRAYYSNPNTTSKRREGYDSQETKDKSGITEFVVPIELNWNILTSENVGLYLGAGFLYGLSSSKALKISLGIPWTHGDFNMYYIKYISGPFYNNGSLSPFVGLSYTYYL